MSAIEKIINKASWRYHMNGGYYEREILDGDIFDQAAAELAAKDAELESLRAVMEAAREVLQNKKFPHKNFAIAELAAALERVTK